MLVDGLKGMEEKSPIHVADVIKMSGLNSSSRESVSAAKSNREGSLRDVEVWGSPSKSWSGESPSD